MRVFVCVMLNGMLQNFVDLAGSERAGQGGAQGIRLKEAGFINKSLLTLGKVISELSRKQRYVHIATAMFMHASTFCCSHISFRESKLTRLLSSSLGGNSQTCILCTVSPNVVEETHLTLQVSSYWLCVYVGSILMYLREYVCMYSITYVW